MTTVAVAAEGEPADVRGVLRTRPLYQLFMLALCVLALLGIIFQYALPHDPEIEAILYPVTNEGRVIAAILMTAGVGLFGAFSAALAAWFLVPEDEATDAEIAGLRDEIQKLCESVERLATQTRETRIS